jgi:hypothetical protein
MHWHTAGMMRRPVCSAAAAVAADQNHSMSGSLRLGPLDLRLSLIGPEALCHSQLTTNSFVIGTAVINTHTVNEQLCCATPYTLNRKTWCNQGFQDSDKHLN